MNRTLQETDPEMACIFDGELERQHNTLVLIPSENYASKAVLCAAGSVMTNKYAEGYPGARYYHGCEWVDKAESLAIARAKALFGCDHVNVQPHTGSQANMTAYYALLEPGDTILAMSVDQGGHLSHGKKANFSGKYYKPVFYHVDRQTEMLDYDEIRRLAREHRPRLIVVGASAYPRTIDFAIWREIADEVGAYLMADIAHIVGLIAGGVHPSPIPYCDVVTSTTHKTLRGPRGAFIMCRQKFAQKIDRALFPGIQAGPLMHIVAAKAVAFHEANSEGFREYQRQIVKNAAALAGHLQAEGIRLVSGGTDNHLMLADVRSIGLTGRQAADALERAGIITNVNLIPYDPNPPTVASGIRPGTPAVTTRGMKEAEMAEIARLMLAVLSAPDDLKVAKQVKEQVRELCARFPIYETLNNHDPYV